MPTPGTLPPKSWASREDAPGNGDPSRLRYQPPHLTDPHSPRTTGAIRNGGRKWSEWPVGTGTRCHSTCPPSVGCSWASPPPSPTLLAAGPAPSLDQVHRGSSFPSRAPQGAVSPQAWDSPCSWTVLASRVSETPEATPGAQDNTWGSGHMPAFPSPAGEMTLLERHAQRGGTEAPGEATPPAPPRPRARICGHNIRSRGQMRGHGCEVSGPLACLPV